MGLAWGWRAAFLLEAGAMVPFCLFCLLAPPVDIRGTHDPGDAEDSHGSDAEDGAAAAGGENTEAAGERIALHRGLPSDGGGGGEGGLRGAPRSAHRRRRGARSTGTVDAAAGWLAGVAADGRQLLRNRVYVPTVLGMTGYTAVLGAYAFYGPKAGRQVFGIAPETADMTFGAITVVTGLSVQPAWPSLSLLHTLQPPPPLGPQVWWAAWLAGWRWTPWAPPCPMRCYSAQPAPVPARRWWSPPLPARTPSPPSRRCSPRASWPCSQPLRLPTRVCAPFTHSLSISSLSRVCALPPAAAATGAICSARRVLPPASRAPLPRAFRHPRPALPQPACGASRRGCVPLP